MLPDAKLNRVLDRYRALEAALAQGAAPEEFVRMSREFAELAPVVRGIDDYRRVAKEIADLETLLGDPSTGAEMRKLAGEELVSLRPSLGQAEHALKLLLLPKDAADEKNAILEVRAGAGGREAGLFAAELFRMYQRYADLKGWKFDPISLAENDLGGVREAIASIHGKGVFARLKYESGVHRVQRVPVTEAGGRIHTSTATVAVLPEAEEVDIAVKDDELRIDVFRSSGPGGQSVNTTDSAVRITHLPSGIVVVQQDEKSQHKNRAKAMKVLRARLFERERALADAKRAAVRKGQVGTGDRSERVRTYNFPQGRVSDHRIGLTLHKIDRVLSGESLDELIDALIAEDQASRLAEAELAS
jgi:peptide chain release factor 1